MIFGKKARADILKFSENFIVPQAGIEPTTLALGVLCSVHLSYWGNDEIIPNSCVSS
jgi:hypothetical protein